jgi:hypothetical protein
MRDERRGTNDQRLLRGDGLSRRRIAPQQSAEAGADNARVTGDFDVGICAEVVAARNLVLGAGGDEHDDGDMRVAAHHAAEHGGVIVVFFQRNQHGIGFVFAEQGKRVKHIFGVDHGIAAADGLRHQRTRKRILIRNQEKGMTIHGAQQGRVRRGQDGCCV